MKDSSLPLSELILGTDLFVFCLEHAGVVSAGTYLTPTDRTSTTRLLVKPRNCREMKSHNLLGPEIKYWNWEGEIISITEHNHNTPLTAATPTPTTKELGQQTFLMITIEIKEILSSEYTNLLLNGPFTHRPLICIEGSKKYGGLWSVFQIENQFISCFSSHDTKQTCDTIWNRQYYLHKPKTVHCTESNLQLLLGECPELPSPRIYLAPPLVWHCLLNIFNIVAIDTVNQTFQVDFYAELRLKYVANHENQDALLKLLECYRTPIAAVDFLNVAEPIGEKEVWTSMGSNNNPGDLLDFIIKIRFKAIFIERMELEDFPFDLQDLNIPLTFNSSVYRVTLRPNVKFPSVFQVTLNSFLYLNFSLLTDLLSVP
jgi:hypothetical protein